MWRNSVTGGWLGELRDAGHFSSSRSASRLWLEMRAPRSLVLPPCLSLLVTSPCDDELIPMEP